MPFDKPEMMASTASTFISLAILSSRSKRRIAMELDPPPEPNHDVGSSVTVTMRKSNMFQYRLCPYQNSQKYDPYMLTPSSRVKSTLNKISSAKKAS